jgi:EAL domain-containing protein (putative c-di-GMP-specific phosphodiesterase class I)
MGDALASFASAIGAGFVAEGIETEPERRHLLSRGVAFGQGFLFGRPAPMPAPV